MRSANIIQGLELSINLTVIQCAWDSNLKTLLYYDNGSDPFLNLITQTQILSTKPAGKKLSTVKIKHSFMR